MDYFYHKLILSAPRMGIKLYIMLRKFTLLLVLLIGLHQSTEAQVRDSVTIYLPPYSDTTCPGSQLDFVAVQSEDTFTSEYYMWYANSVYTGVSIDTFHTTALNDGDSVYCVIYFINSLGVLDSFRSNVITIYRSSSIRPRVVVSLIAGSNPDCAGHPLTFQAFPVNGGTAPIYQWLINNVPVLGADTSIFTGTFGGSDTISCMMVSNSTCSAPYNDTAYSNIIPIIHIHLTAAVSIVATQNPICEGLIDTFTATLVNPGTGYTLSWYISGTLVPGAVGNIYITDSLNNGDLVYCILNPVDSCISNDTAVSPPITMTVIPNNNNTVSTTLIAGSNPGCLDAPVTFKGVYSNFGIAPSYTWYVNGVPVAIDTTVFTSLFLNGDVVTFVVNPNDGGCYLYDTVTTTSVLMIRDSTPSTPLVSLITNLLVANTAGHYTWYYTPTCSYTDGVIIAGATAQTYHPGVLGCYYAVRDTGNCPSLPSNIIYISLLSVNNLTHADINIYPNPTSGMLNLDFGATNVTMHMELYNMLGQVIMKEEITNAAKHETNLSRLPEGNYMVVLTDQDGSKATYKILLSK